MRAWTKAGCLQMYIWKVLEAQHPIAWMQSGGTPARARAVTPPEHKEWPPKLPEKWVRKCRRYQDLVGTEPELWVCWKKRIPRGKVGFEDGDGKGCRGGECGNNN